jgi:hypothetical protein
MVTNKSVASVCVKYNCLQTNAAANNFMQLLEPVGQQPYTNHYNLNNDLVTALQEHTAINATK